MSLIHTTRSRSTAWYVALILVIAMFVLNLFGIAAARFDSTKAPPHRPTDPSIFDEPTIAAR
jgi:hypothetical protein